ncbi:MAG: hypothetical protein HY706_09385 [Candidatus Hydrogenedentes bacterium]|nr:hypothetical protein [Candidatus Hydrogenedentota bacterium]
MHPVRRRAAALVRITRRETGANTIQSSPSGNTRHLGTDTSHLLRVNVHAVGFLEKLELLEDTPQAELLRDEANGPVGTAGREGVARSRDSANGRTTGDKSPVSPVLKKPCNCAAASLLNRFVTPCRGAWSKNFSS